MNRDVYEIALSKTKEKRNELNQSFDTHSNDEQLLANSKIPLVLEEWGKQLGIDIQNAKDWFQKENSQIPDSIELE